MTEFKFNLTPDPKILIALTHTPLQPLDALCELIDNAIDSFSVAKLQGSPIEFSACRCGIARKPLKSIAAKVRSVCGTTVRA